MVAIHIKPLESCKKPLTKLWDNPSFTEKFLKTTADDCALTRFVSTYSERSNNMHSSHLPTSKCFITKIRISTFNDTERGYSDTLVYNFTTFPQDLQIPGATKIVPLPVWQLKSITFKSYLVERPVEVYIPALQATSHPF